MRIDELDNERKRGYTSQESRGGLHLVSERRRQRRQRVRMIGDIVEKGYCNIITIMG